ncbi:MAG: recombinase family protein, partial [Blautia sp.]|nr:recombinase family protein [Blautia sp.]
MKNQGCYIYTRVSTAMQVDGFSLDAQKEKLRKYAEFQNLPVFGEYSDEGKSGKNIAGRPQFQQMMEDISSGKDPINYVLVFKLSRFGRNAADVLYSLQEMQDYGVNLICVEDGIDSSKDSGKLMISVLSAVAEIERENILIQTMEGRKQKAREGKWNGGFAPYGYKLVDGLLEIAEDEAETIRLIFDKYVNTNMGAGAIAKYLNQHGYAKKQRQNGTLPVFSAHFITKVLDNPVYVGKLAYGRRKNEKIPGVRNQYHVVQQDEFPIYEGVHEAIVSEEDWLIARKKRAETNGKREKLYSLEHEHILSGILVCPVCGGRMYGNVNRKKKPDGTMYKDHFYYACKHRLEVDGHRCDYRRQWTQDRINGAVEEIIKKLVDNPRFEAAMREKIDGRVDTAELDAEIESLRKKLRQLNGAKAKLAQQMDHLDVLDPHYGKKYDDMQSRMDTFYEEIEDVEEEIDTLQDRVLNIRNEKITGDNIYQFLQYYGIMYNNFTDAEKKEFMKVFLERVEIFKDPLPNGQLLKKIVFAFPVFINGEELLEICWDEKFTSEAVFSIDPDTLSLGNVYIEEYKVIDVQPLNAGSVFGNTNMVLILGIGIPVIVIAAAVVVLVL